MIGVAFDGHQLAAVNTDQAFNFHREAIYPPKCLYYYNMHVLNVHTTVVSSKADGYYNFMLKIMMLGSHRKDSTRQITIVSGPVQQWQD